MDGILTAPTAEDVRNAINEFNGWKDNPDPALTELFKLYPANTNFDHVLLKVVALNALYSTLIRVNSKITPTVYDVARHIVGLDIDGKLALGSEDLVHKIAYTEIQGKETRFNYSFATKYCNWHQPDFFPIWDSRVDLYLWELRNRETGKPEGFRQFKHKELWRYPEFKKVVDDFKAHFRLEDFSFKLIDKFLFVEGGKLLAAKEREKQSAAAAESQPMLSESNEDEKTNS